MADHISDLVLLLQQQRLGPCQDLIALGSRQNMLAERTLRCCNRLVHFLRCCYSILRIRRIREFIQYRIAGITVSPGPIDIHMIVSHDKSSVLDLVTAAIPLYKTGRSLAWQAFFVIRPQQ